MTAKCPFEAYRGWIIRITTHDGASRFMFVPMNCEECEQYDSALQCCELLKEVDEA